MLSDLHRHNLSILADYLLKLPIDYPHFAMDFYNLDDDYDPGGLASRKSCGSAACAVGHVPYTGIIGWETYDNWNDLASELLGAEPVSGEVFRFMFHGSHIDCPWQAAWRILHFLNTGLTEGQYLPHGLRVEQFANCKKLAAYLLELPDDYDKFDMWWYTQNGKQPQDTDCGTVACAAGHGPAAGIEPLPGEGWSTYTHRVFSASAWMFASQWSLHDNTVEGAAKRIIYALRNRILPEVGDVRAYA